MTVHRRTRKTEDKAPCLVKFARIGGTVKEYALNGEKTVEELLDIVDESVDEDETIRVNGKKADLDTELESGDVVTVAEQVDGGTN